MQLHVIVRGRVQGVGFRWFVREIARRRGMTGWVRNLADGSVEVAADGDGDAIADLRSSLRSGPPGSSVTSLDELASVPGELPQPFSILR
ncbi:MAG: acylphosphatase [Gemmatimonadetes bacterium]|nr:acylphosphatase [Gemmatimonadota bacterium]